MFPQTSDELTPNRSNTDFPDNENSSKSVAQLNCEESSIDRDAIVPETPIEDDDRNAVVCNGLFCTLSINECRNLHYFDDNGKLYCPNCWYKCQIMELEELEKEMILAKNNAQRARKSVSLFLNSSKVSDYQLGDKCEERIHVNQLKSGEVVEVGSGGHDDMENGIAIGVDVSEKVTFSPIRNGQGVEVHCTPSKNKAGRVETRVGGDDDRGNVNGIDQDFCLLGEVFGQPRSHENINDEAGMVEEEGEKENEQHAHLHHTSVDDVNPFASFQYQDSAVHQRNNAYEDKVSFEESTCPGETAVNCNELSGASRKPAKCYKPAKRSTNPALPDSRRRKLPWSTEEEEMLRKAVQVFSLEGRKNFSWKSILEYGGLVFNGTRTPVDLKDKWRNMEGSRGKHR